MKANVLVHKMRETLPPGQKLEALVAKVLMLQVKKDQASQEELERLEVGMRRLEAQNSFQEESRQFKNCIRR